MPHRGKFCSAPPNSNYKRSERQGHTACVHDNASNIVLTNQHPEWESVECFAHTLQLAVTDGFKANAMTWLIGACTRLVRHFHHSTVATVALKKKQEQQALPQHTLIQS